MGRKEGTILSGAIFNLVFTFVSFSVLWFQPADSKSFFISLLIAAGAWWTSMIAQTVDKAKLAVYGQGFKECYRLTQFLIVSDMILRIIAVIIGLFLFWVSLMGTMGFLLFTVDAKNIEGCKIVINTASATNNIPGFLDQILPQITLISLFRANIIALILSVFILILQPILEMRFYSHQQLEVLSDNAVKKQKTKCSKKERVEEQ